MLSTFTSVIVCAKMADGEAFKLCYGINTGNLSTPEIGSLNKPCSPISKGDF